MASHRFEHISFVVDKYQVAPLRKILKSIRKKLPLNFSFISLKIEHDFLYINIAQANSSTEEAEVIRVITSAFYQENWGLVSHIKNVML